MVAPKRRYRSGFSCWIALLLLLLAGCGGSDQSAPVSEADDSEEIQQVASELSNADAAPIRPWDFDPYKVLVWFVSDDPDLTSASLRPDVEAVLRQDFGAIWRADFADAPPSVRTAVTRDITGLDFEGLAATDPVLALKRTHPEAIRIQEASDFSGAVSSVLGNADAIRSLTRRVRDTGDEAIGGLGSLLKPFANDNRNVVELWADPSTEALLVNRGVANTLTNPGAKLISPPIGNLIGETTKTYDKIFIVQIFAGETPGTVRAIEFDTMMRYFSPPASSTYVGRADLASSIGRAVTHAFAPVVRVDDAGTKRASGYVRAGGLIVDSDSPAKIVVGDVLRPMIRKNDRNGRPIMIGPVDWAYLLVKEAGNRKCKMDIHSGRSGGLSVRMNNRTFRVALKVSQPHPATTLRLHAKSKPDEPLIGYEIYERELDSKDMTFVGRTNWNGQLTVTPNDDPLRLFYVKNGGAVLARMPMVPGMLTSEVADMAGDDMRLKAEAYIIGVQNSIIDLVAIRELFAARIRSRLKNSELEKAKDLLVQLREQPTNQTIADDLSRKQDEFLKLIGRNANQRRKVDNLFATTRDILTQFINSRLVSELESEVIAAEREAGGGLSSSNRTNNNAASDAKPADPNDPFAEGKTAFE